MTPTGGLRILITNNTLGGRAGSEMYVRDLAVGLLRRGHRPVVYSTILGEVAELLRRATVPVVDDLNALSATPDLIHGQHHLETMTAVQRFPHVPAVSVCHGWMPWEESPPVFPSIRRHVAVDDLCAERLYTTAGIESARVRTIYNGVDLERFRPRGSLPDHPKSALIFSNYAGLSGFSEAIRSACLSHGIARVDVAGNGSGQVTRSPETLLPNYDLVFAKARCALEAMAVGCATVVADFSGLGGLVTTGNVQSLRRLNFGMRTMQAVPITEATVLAELRRYAKSDAAEVSDWIRQDASFEAVVDSLLTVYREALDERIDVPAHAVPMASASYLKSLSPRLKSINGAEARAHSATSECLAIKSQMEASREREQTALTTHAALEREIADLREHLLALERETSLSAAALHSLRQEAVELRERLSVSEREAGLSAAALHSLQQEAVELRERLSVSERETSLSAAAIHSLEQEGAELRARLGASEREKTQAEASIGTLGRNVAELHARLAGMQQEMARMEAGLQVQAQDAAAFRIERDEAQRTLREIYGSRAWRAVTAYRRLRAWLT